MKSLAPTAAPSANFLSLSAKACTSVEKSGIEYGSKRWRSVMHSWPTASAAHSRAFAAVFDLVASVSVSLATTPCSTSAASPSAPADAAMAEAAVRLATSSLAPAICSSAPLSIVSGSSPALIVPALMAALRMAAPAREAELAISCESLPKSLLHRSMTRSTASLVRPAASSPKSLRTVVRMRLASSFLAGGLSSTASSVVHSVSARFELTAVLATADAAFSEISRTVALSPIRRARTITLWSTLSSRLVSSVSVASAPISVARVGAAVVVVMMVVVGVVVVGVVVMVVVLVKLVCVCALTLDGTHDV